jgi:hypothetical protein
MMPFETMRIKGLALTTIIANWHGFGRYIVVIFGMFASKFWLGLGSVIAVAGCAENSAQWFATAPYGDGFLQRTNAKFCAVKPRMPRDLFGYYLSY